MKQCRHGQEERKERRCSRPARWERGATTSQVHAPHARHERSASVRRALRECMDQLAEMGGGDAGSERGRDGRTSDGDAAKMRRVHAVSWSED
jgi:hypothetical protein